MARQPRGGLTRRSPNAPDPGLARPAADAQLPLGAEGEDERDHLLYGSA